MEAAPELLRGRKSITTRAREAYEAHQRRQNPFAQARRFKAAFDLPGVDNESDVARVMRCSRPRVSQMLGLLRLPPYVAEWIEGRFEVPAVRRFFTERRLRPLTTLDADDVRNEFDRLLADFNATPSGTSMAITPTAHVCTQKSRDPQDGGI